MSPSARIRRRARLSGLVSGARGGARGAFRGAAFARCLRLRVQRLRDARGTPRVGQTPHLDFESFLTPRDDERVADVHLARGLRTLTTDFDLAGLDRVLREA